MNTDKVQIYALHSLSGNFYIPTTKLMIYGLPLLFIRQTCYGKFKKLNFSPLIKYKRKIEFYLVFSIYGTKARKDSTLDFCFYLLCVISKAYKNNQSDLQ